MRLDELTGVITGAASGLGRATAKRLSEKGAKLLLVDLDESRLNEVWGGHKEHYIGCADITDETQVREVLNEGLKELNELRFLVNCAGIPSAAKVVSRGVAHDLALWNHVINVNLTGTFNMLRLTAESMSQNSPDSNGQRGVIVNTSSIAAFDGLKGQAAYTASKAAIAGMTLPIARDLAEFGIRCMSIAPGVFQTELTASVPEKGREAMERNFLFPKRCGEPDEFAHMVQMILTNPYLNGTCYRIDGATRFAP